MTLVQLQMYVSCPFSLFHHVSSVFSSGFCYLWRVSLLCRVLPLVFTFCVIHCSLSVCVSSYLINANAGDSKAELFQLSSAQIHSRRSSILPYRYLLFSRQCSLASFPSGLRLLLPPFYCFLFRFSIPFTPCCLLHIHFSASFILIKIFLFPFSSNFCFFRHQQASVLFGPAFFPLSNIMLEAQIQKEL